MNFNIFPLIAKAYDYYRDPEIALIKSIIKSIDKATKSVISNSSNLQDKDFYWDKKELRKYFTTVLISDKQFSFFHCNEKELYSDIKVYLVNTSDHLDTYDKEQITTNILRSAQHLFLKTVINDKKVSRYLDLRHSSSVANDLVDLAKETMDITDNDSINSSFGEGYRKIVSSFENEDYALALQLINDIINNRTFENDEQYLALRFIEIAAHYNRFEYETAYKILLDIGEYIPNQKRHLQFKYYGIKGSVLSEKGSSYDDSKLIRLAVKEFEKQSSFIQGNSFNDKDAFEVYYNMGTSYLTLSQIDREDPEIARQYFELALELNNTYPELLKNLGTTYSLLHLHEQEVNCYKRALDINPNLFEALCAMGFVELVYNQNPSSALTYYKKAYTQEENLSRSASIFYWFSEAYMKNDNSKKAKEILDKGLKYFPSSQYLIDKKIEVLIALQRDNPKLYTDDLVIYIQNENHILRDTDIEKIVSAYYYAERYDDLNHFLDNLTTEQQRIPDLMFIYYLYGLQLHKNGDEKANKILAEMAKINLSKIDDEFQIDLFYFLLGIMQSEMNDFKNALESLEKVNLKQFADYEINMMKGEIALELEEFGQARDYFRKAKNIANGDYFDTYYGLSRANLGLRKTQPAKTSIIKMTELCSLVLSSEVLKGKQINEKIMENARIRDLLECTLSFAITKALNHIFKNETIEVTKDRFHSLYSSYLNEIHEEVFPIIFKSVYFSEHNMTNFLMKKMIEAEKDLITDSNLLGELSL
ncbi:hypothetical protein ACA30_13465 [Virgibacillus soli]|nr:hypothetical protein ACA30_13465 [Virgibacillus soli]